MGSFLISFNLMLENKLQSSPFISGIGKMRWISLDLENDPCIFCISIRINRLKEGNWFACWAGKVILESVILTTVVVVALTLYTFWAAKRGHDFNFLGPFLFGAVLVLMVFGLIQVYSNLRLVCSYMFLHCISLLNVLIWDSDTVPTG